MIIYMYVCTKWKRNHCIDAESWSKIDNKLKKWERKLYVNYFATYNSWICLNSYLLTMTGWYDNERIVHCRGRQFIRVPMNRIIWQFITHSWDVHDRLFISEFHINTILNKTSSQHATVVSAVVTQTFIGVIRSLFNIDRLYNTSPIISRTCCPLLLSENDRIVVSTDNEMS